MNIEEKRGDVSVAKKSICYLTIICIICFSLCGCTPFLETLPAPISPPKRSQDKKQIYDALKETVGNGGNVSLKSPQNGDYRSSIILHDFKKGKGEEAIAFYENKSSIAFNETTLRVCLLSKTKDKWNVTWDIPGAGTKIDKVLFYHNNQTDEEYFIIGYIKEEDNSTQGTSNQKYYNIYRYNEGTVSLVCGENYQMMETYDIKGNGQEEFITTVYQPETLDLSEIASDFGDNNFYNYNLGLMGTISNNKLNIESGTIMQSANGGVTNCTTQKDNTSLGRPALILNEQEMNSGYVTEVLTFENGKLKNRFDSLSLRKDIPYCCDIDRDGTIDIPGEDTFIGYDNKLAVEGYSSNYNKIDSSKEIVKKINWYKLTKDGLSEKKPSYVDYSLGVAWMFPKNWPSNVTIKKHVEDNRVDFFIYHGDLNNDSDKLFSLKTKSIRDQYEKSDGWFEIASIGQVIYLGKIHEIENTKYQITEDEAKENFAQIKID